MIGSLVEGLVVRVTVTWPNYICLIQFVHIRVVVALHACPDLEMREAMPHLSTDLNNESYHKTMENWYSTHKPYTLNGQYQSEEPTA